MKTNPKMIIMCSLPAGGKNTWIKKHSANYVVVELDAIRKIIFGHQFHQNAEPHIIAMAKSFARLLCSQGKNVIINSTGLTFGIRNEWIRLAKEYDYRTEIVFIDTPFKTCCKRNDKRVENKVPPEVMDRMILMLQKPLTKAQLKCGMVLPDAADKITIIKG